MNTFRLPLRFLLWTTWVLVSLGLVGYGWMLQRVDQAQALYWEGSPDAAVEAFGTLNVDLRSRWWLARLFPSTRERVQNNYLALLYARGDFDAVIQEAQASMLDYEIPPQAINYWLGNAYYRKAITSPRDAPPEETMAWLRRAGEQYQSAIAKSSLDWDLKYNHELMQTLLNRSGPKVTQDKIFDLLRPDDKSGPQPPPPSGRRVG